MVSNDADVCACVCCSEPNPNKKSSETKSSSSGSTFSSVGGVAPFKFGFEVGAATTKPAANGPSTSSSSTNSFTFGAPVPATTSSTGSTFTFGAAKQTDSSNSVTAAPAVSTSFKFGFSASTSATTTTSDTKSSANSATFGKESSTSSSNGSKSESSSSPKPNPFFPVLKSISPSPSINAFTGPLPNSTDKEMWKCEVCSALVPMDKSKCTSCDTCYKPKSFIPTGSSPVRKNEIISESEVKPGSDGFGPFFGGRNNSPMKFGTQTNKKFEGFSSSSSTLFGQQSGQFGLGSGSSGGGTGSIFGGNNGASSSFPAPAVASSGFSFSSPTEDMTDSKKISNLFGSPDQQQTSKRKRPADGDNGVETDEVDHKRKVSMSPSNVMTFGAPNSAANFTEINGSVKTDNPFMKGGPTVPASGGAEKSPFGTPIPALMGAGASGPAFSASANAPKTTPGPFTFGAPAANATTNSSSGGLFTFGSSATGSNPGTFPGSGSAAPPGNNNNNSMMNFKNPNPTFTLPRYVNLIYNFTFVVIVLRSCRNNLLFF